MIISSFIQWLVLGYMVKEFLHTNLGYDFPDLDVFMQIVQERATKLSYDIVYFIINNFSKAQIMYNKWNKQITKPHAHAVSIDFCKNGEILKSVVLDKEFKDVEMEHVQCDISNYDFVLVTDDLHGEKNKICLTDKSKNVMEVEKSNIKFLSFNVHYKNESYDIKLYSDKENFYTVKNRINKNFLKFQLKQMGVDVCEEFPYKINIIDHDVNIIELDNNHEIIIEKDSYEIQKAPLPEPQELPEEGGVRGTQFPDEGVRGTQFPDEGVRGTQFPDDEDDFVKVENTEKTSNQLFHPGYVV
jgi:hypothetical protein